MRYQCATTSKLTSGWVSASDSGLLTEKVCVLSRASSRCKSSVGIENGVAYPAVVITLGGAVSECHWDDKVLRRGLIRV
jgi:hypothetical protein